MPEHITSFTTDKDGGHVTEIDGATFIEKKECIFIIGKYEAYEKLKCNAK